MKEEKADMYKSLFHNRKGAILVSVLILFSFIILLSLTLLELSVMNAKMKNIEYRAKAAYYLAEAGLEEVYILITKEVKEGIEQSFLQGRYLSEEGIVTVDEGIFRQTYQIYINQHLVQAIQSYSCTVLEPELSNVPPRITILSYNKFSPLRNTFSLTFSSSIAFEKVTQQVRAQVQISTPDNAVTLLENEDFPWIKLYYLPIE